MPSAWLGRAVRSATRRPRRTRRTSCPLVVQRHDIRSEATARGRVRRRRCRRRAPARRGRCDWRASCGRSPSQGSARADEIGDRATKSARRRRRRSRCRRGGSRVAAGPSVAPWSSNQRPNTGSASVDGDRRVPADRRRTTSARSPVERRRLGVGTDTSRAASRLPWTSSKRPSVESSPCTNRRAGVRRRRAGPTRRRCRGSGGIVGRFGPDCRGGHGRVARRGLGRGRGRRSPCRAPSRTRSTALALRQPFLR